ncbi:phage tail assembly chaperone [Sphingomonas nostoxanthinifaciens]|nr:phage tail assembly chaperone [Sphingomonas nostoxanthinifaciens]
MGIALDAFGWTPDTFWRSTPCELWAMIEARQRANAEIEKATRG